MPQKCPIFSIAPEINSWVDCLEEGCAWWVEEERCAIPQVVRELDRLTDRLDLNLREQLGNLNQNIPI